MARVAAQPPSAGITICNRVGTTGYRAQLWDSRARAIRSRVKLQFTNCPFTIHVTGWSVRSQAPPCGLPSPLTWREKAEAQHRGVAHFDGGDEAQLTCLGTRRMATAPDWQYFWRFGRGITEGSELRI